MEWGVEEAGKFYCYREIVGGESIWRAARPGVEFEGWLRSWNQCEGRQTFCKLFLADHLKPTTNLSSS
jgi:predicted small integral membrane protein